MRRPGPAGARGLLFEAGLAREEVCAAWGVEPGAVLPSERKDAGDTQLQASASSAVTTTQSRACRDSRPSAGLRLNPISSQT